MDDRGSEFESRQGKKYSLLHVVQTGSGAHPAPLQWVPVVISPGVKRMGRETNHSPKTSAKVMKTWIYTYIPPYAFMVLVRVPGYRSRGPGFDSGCYEIFWEVVGLERDPLSLVRITEDLENWD
jgi:hypothetical protein